MTGGVSIFPVKGLPEVNAGDDLVGLLLTALEQQGHALQNGDVLVVTQKVVSKAEGRLIDPQTVVPSALARQFADVAGKDPGEVEVVLGESKRIVRMVGRVLISETRHGFVCANAGVDHSNVDGGALCLLPVDPDKSAQAIRLRIQERADAQVAVIISDTFGRPWRLGQTNVAIGVSGMLPLINYAGSRDTYGRELRVTALAVADELASAAELVMNKVDQVPVAVIRGYPIVPGEVGARSLVRPSEQDLFR